MTIAEITKKFREEQNLTQQDFADALCQAIPGYEKVKQEISAWENSKQSPDYLFAVLVSVKYSDWRRDWAMAVLAELKPHIWMQGYSPARMVESGDLS